MATTVLDFYCDTFRKVAVAGKLSSSAVIIPAFCYGDTYTFRVRALAQTANFPSPKTPYDFIQNTGKTLQLAVGTPGGTTPLTQQYTWDLSGDTEDPYFYADVAFNTPAILAALGDEETFRTNLEIKLVDGGTPKRILKAQIDIDASIIASATVTTPPGLTPASMEAVLALLANPVVDTLTIRSPDHTHSRVLTVGNDGTPGDNPIS